MRRDPRERGVALLTVLMLVAVVAVIAGAALERLSMATRLAGNAAAIAQARNYARAAEVLAQSRVDDLLGRDPSRVTLAGGWSDQPFGLPLPGSVGGAAVARVSDGGNCFNLNGLVTAVAPGVYRSDPLMQARFVRLMQMLQIPTQVAAQVAAGAADWIDTDSDQGVQGAEDASYAGLNPAYRTSGTLMTDISELRAVAGVTPQLYATLAPWLCALPVAAPAKVNVNTLAPERAALVAMAAPDTMSVDAARQVLLRRPPAGFADLSAFTGVDNKGLDIKSTWFALKVEVAQGPTRIEQRSLIDATRLPSRLVSRQWGE